LTLAKNTLYTDNRLAVSEGGPLASGPSFLDLERIEDMISSELVNTILQRYSLSPKGTHGVSHWARVLENGRTLARRTGAIIEVVELFAVFHDAKRANEGWDSEHGYRGAEFAAQLWGANFKLSGRDFDMLYAACSDHTKGITAGDITVQTCWDADRLDLGRVGIMPDIQYLCTDAAKESEIIAWAERRSRERFIPPLIQEEWALRLEKK
jgi:uncharacterized protein